VQHMKMSPWRRVRVPSNSKGVQGLADSQGELALHGTPRGAAHDHEALAPSQSPTFSEGAQGVADAGRQSWRWLGPRWAPQLTSKGSLMQIN